MTTRATFIGQQSWLLEVAGATVLVDPVLTDSFGNSPRLRFEIYPGRTVHVDRMPRLDAVVVSNEHLDHFHLPSLRLLDPGVPVVLPAMTPDVCVEALRATGADVRLLGPDEEFAAADAGIRFLAGEPTAPVWESRVASVWVAERGSTAGGVLVQSDTELGPEAAGLGPELLIATHNAQIPPAGQLGAFDNLLPLPPDVPAETTGLNILQHLLGEVTSKVARCRYVLLSGGGYVQSPPKHGEFLWADQRELATIANALSIDGRLVGLVPGEAFTADPAAGPERVDWISPREVGDPPARSDKDDRAEVDFAGELEPLFDTEVTAADRALIEAELRSMAPLLMLSKLGRSLVDVNSYLGQGIGPHRFAVHLRGYADGDRLFVLNLNTAGFEPLDGSLRDAVFTIPSGIDLWAADLAAVLRGDIHVWELAVSRMRQWYVTDPLESPVAFLYGYFSEQVRPDLAEQLYVNGAAC